MVAGDIWPSYHVVIDAASNTAVKMPSRPSMRFRPKLAENCAKSGPITTPRFGEGGGPDVRSAAIQALAASVSSCHTSVRKPAGSIASRVADAVKKKARCRRSRPRDGIVRLAAVQHDVEGCQPAA